MKVTPDKGRLLLFVEALESDEYKQCNDKLTIISKDGKTTHCCLGVATEVALANGLEGVERVPTQDTGQTRDIVAYMHQNECGFGEELKRETNFLPTPVMNWYGLSTRNPALQDPEGFRHSQSATALNDDLKLDFTEIAAWFRHTYDLGPKPE